MVNYLENYERGWQLSLLMQFFQDYFPVNSTRCQFFQLRSPIFGNFLIKIKKYYWKSYDTERDTMRSLKDMLEEYTREKKKEKKMSSVLNVHPIGDKKKEQKIIPVKMSFS